MNEVEIVASQTKKQSFNEALTNVAIGWGIALASQVAFFTAFNIPISLNENILLSVYMTMVSIVRSYLLRRYFNNKQKKVKNV